MVYMFNNPFKADSSEFEGIVAQVDPLRKACAVITPDGRPLTGVMWEESVGGSSRYGDRSSPTMGDRVVVNTSLGYPRISGYLPKLQSTDNVFSVSIDTDGNLIDTGNYMNNAGGAVVADQNKPADILAGDRVISTNGGAIIAALRGGSVMLRASRLAQILLSKWDSVVKVVSRSWEHYTDVHSDIIRNNNGYLYRYTGYAGQNALNDSISENYTLNFYYGDVENAEATKTNYLLNQGGNTGEEWRSIYKEQVTDRGDMSYDSEGSSWSPPIELMYRKLHNDGSQETFVRSERFAGSDLYDKESTNQTNKAHVWSVWYGGFSGMGSNGGTFDNRILVTDNVIEIVRDDGDDNARIWFDPDGVHISYQDNDIHMLVDGTHHRYKDKTIDIIGDGIHLASPGSTVDLVEGDGIHLAYSGATVDMVGDGIHLAYGGGNVDMTSGGVFTTHSGHFCNVTAGGVALG
jgi:hypothetical protein